MILNSRILLSAAILSLLLSCKNTPEPLPASYDDPAAGSAPAEAVDEAQLHKQYQDSIAAAAEKKRQLMEEEIQRKKIDAETSIAAFSSQLMKLVSPASGKNLEYHILDDESSYNQVTGTYTGVFETSWDAYPGYFNSKYELHVFKGSIMVYGNGEIRYQEISKNDALVRGIESNKAANKLAGFINSMSQDSSE